MTGPAAWLRWLLPSALIDGLNPGMACLAQDPLGKIGRLTFPLAMFAYPFYLWKRSPGKTGSHYDPACDLFVPQEASLV